MLSRKAKYGLKAMFMLAREAGKAPVLASAIAEQERVPRKFLDQILLQLTHSGLVESRRGKGGGYRLGRPADAITLGEIVRRLDGPLAPVSCVSETAYRRCDECVSEATCEVRHVMKQVREATASILDRTTLAGGRARRHRRVPRH